MHTVIPRLGGRDGRLPVSDELASLAKQYAPGAVRNPIAKNKSSDIDLWSSHVHACTCAHAHSYLRMCKRTRRSKHSPQCGEKEYLQIF